MLGPVPVQNSNNAPQELQGTFFGIMSPAKNSLRWGGRPVCLGHMALVGCGGGGGPRQTPELPICQATLWASRGKTVFSFVCEHLTIYFLGNRKKLGVTVPSSLEH